jgi:hypothetical protein
LARGRLGTQPCDPWCRRAWILLRAAAFLLPAPQVQRAEPGVPGGGVRRGRTCPVCRSQGCAATPVRARPGGCRPPLCRPGMCVNTELCSSGSPAGEASERRAAGCKPGGRRLTTGLTADRRAGVEDELERNADEWSSGLTHNSGTGKSRGLRTWFLTSGS